MGPRLFRRGNYLEQYVYTWGGCCFNGATSFQTWKPGSQSSARRATKSFNGATSFQTWKLHMLLPWSFEAARFNGATSFQTWKLYAALGDVAQKTLALQWGHVFSDVETIELVGDAKAKDSLQWGHVFSDVETTGVDLRVIRNEELQWGHVFSDVETVYLCVFFSLDLRASMGPRLFRRGNQGRKMGRIFFSPASMGPRLFRRGNKIVGFRVSDELYSFNGATSFQTWKRRTSYTLCSPALPAVLSSSLQEI